MNKICISGRLVKDPDLKILENNNAVCTIFIANDVHFGNNKKTSFFKCTAWGNIGKIIKEHGRQGTELYITGRLEQNKYQDKDGKTVYDVSIVVEQFDFGAKPETVSDTHDNPEYNQTTNSHSNETEKHLDDMPF